MHNKVSIRALALFVCCAAFLLSMSACAPAADTGEGEVYYRFSDDRGTTVTLTSRPLRVAVLFSSFAQIWTCAGGEIAVTVGESVERGFAKEGTPLVDAGAGKTVNTEALIAAAPDFVICSADVARQVEAARLLEQNGIPAACFTVESFSDYLRVLRIFTDLTQNPDAYRRYGSDVKARIDQMLAGIEGKMPEKGRILFIRAGSSASSTKAKTARDHFAAAMLEEIGTENIADAVPILLDGLSIEAILLADPDLILISTMGDAEAAKQNVNALMQTEAWQTLRAVQNKNYAYLPKELFQFKPNARWDEAYAYLINLVYENETKS